jgi:hypothetical protein
VEHSVPLYLAHPCTWSIIFAIKRKSFHLIEVLSIQSSFVICSILSLKIGSVKFISIGDVPIPSRHPRNWLILGPSWSSNICSRSRPPVGTLGSAASGHFSWPLSSHAFCGLAFLWPHLLNIASTLTSLISTRLIMRLIYSVVCSMCLARHWIYPLARVANDTYTWSSDRWSTPLSVGMSCK